MLAFFTSTSPVGSLAGAWFQRCARQDSWPVRGSRCRRQTAGAQLTRCLTAGHQLRLAALTLQSQQLDHEQQRPVQPARRRPGQRCRYAAPRGDAFSGPRSRCPFASGQPPFASGQPQRRRRVVGRTGQPSRAAASKAFSGQLPGSATSPWRAAPGSCCVSAPTQSLRDIRFRLSAKISSRWIVEGGLDQGILLVALVRNCKTFHHAVCIKSTEAAR